MEKYSAPLFLLFLVVSGNYIGQLLPCRLQRSFTSNMYLKHLIAFMILLFVIEIDSDNYETLSELLLNTFIVYLIFLFMSRLNSTFFLMFIISIIIIYILSVYRDKLAKEDKSNVNKMLGVLYYISGGILLVGTIISYRRKMVKYGKDFSNLTFLFGDECKFTKNNKPITK